MRNIVTIDPAARDFAWAIFHRKILVACGYGKRFGDIPLQEELEYAWVLEEPQNYQRFSVAHKDLDRLRRTLSRLEVRIKGRGERVKRVRPHKWKRGVPKPIHHRRCWKVLGTAERRLLPDEPRADMAYKHDVHDAVGIGLTELGRIRPGGRRA